MEGAGKRICIVVCLSFSQGSSALVPKLYKCKPMGGYFGASCLSQGSVPRMRKKENQKEISGKPRTGLSFCPKWHDSVIYGLLLKLLDFVFSWTVYGCFGFSCVFTCTVCFNAVLLNS